MAGLQLGHVRHVDPSIIPEGDRVLTQGVGLALEYSTVQLDLICGEMRVHSPAIPKEVLSVPELSLDPCCDIHGL